MSNLKIHRVNKRSFQIRDGKKVLRDCSNFKEAANALIAEELNMLDEFYAIVLEDYEDLDSYLDA